MAPLKAKPLAIAGIALALLAVLGYWGYGAYTQLEARRSAAALIKDTAERLRQALRLEADGRTPTVEVVGEFDSHLAAVDRNYSELRRLDPGALGGLAAAADDYVITAREILRRLAISNRARLSLASSSETLRNHMRSDRGAAAWPGEAVRQRERVDHDYRDYRLAAATLVKLIDSFPASQSLVTPYVEPALLIEPGILAAARVAAATSAKAIATEIGDLTKLETHR